MRKQYVIVFAIVAGTCILGVLGLGKILNLHIFRWSDRRVAETYDRASRIIGALDAFRDITGYYPPNLDILVPDFLAEVVPPVAGNGSWQYWVSDDRSVFNLTFEGDSWSEPTHIYSSNNQIWWVDTK